MTNPKTPTYPGWMAPRKTRTGWRYGVRRFVDVTAGLITLATAGSAALMFTRSESPVTWGWAAIFYGATAYCAVRSLMRPRL